LLAGPAGIVAVILGPGAEYEIDDVIAEIFGVADAGRFFYFLQFFIQCRAVKAFACIGITVFFLLNPVL